MSDSEQQGALTSFKSGLHQRLKAPNYRLNNRETPAATLFLLGLKEQMKADRWSQKYINKSFYYFLKKTCETFARPTFCVEMILHSAACGTFIYDFIYIKKNKKKKPNRNSWAAVLENLTTKTDWNAANISDQGRRKIWCRQCSKRLEWPEKTYTVFFNCVTFAEYTRGPKLLRICQSESFTKFTKILWTQQLTKLSIFLRESGDFLQGW